MRKNNNIYLNRLSSLYSLFYKEQYAHPHRIGHSGIPLCHIRSQLAIFLCVQLVRNSSGFESKLILIFLNFKNLMDWSRARLARAEKKVCFFESRRKEPALNPQPDAWSIPTCWRTQILLARSIARIPALILPNFNANHRLSALSQKQERTQN